MCTDAILECLPKDVKGLLTRTYQKEISLSDWQKYDSSWDVLLTEETRQHFITLLQTLRSNVQFSHFIPEMVEIYNESYGESRLQNKSMLS